MNLENARRLMMIVLVVVLALNIGGAIVVSKVVIVGLFTVVSVLHLMTKQYMLGIMWAFFALWNLMK